MDAMALILLIKLASIAFHGKFRSSGSTPYTTSATVDGIASLKAWLIA